MTTATIEGAPVGEVYTSLLTILKELSVAKNGTLPNNMGGKPYLTAVDVARETKALFVEQDLIILPREEIFRHESVINKDRINVLIAITAEYTIVSTRDGSSVTISGTGDGLAGGTAVASNIASTNALKNALLRTFLITEQSVEDSAKSGPPEASEPATTSAAQRKVAQAQAATTPAAATGGELAVLNERIRKYIGSDDVKKDDVNQRISAAKATNGGNATAARKTVIEDLKIGEDGKVVES